ncbi:ABC transporter (permease) for alpha-galacturonides [Microbacterium sp. 8M]|uniref:carbohydrate ABC transporter permease n=1 Tax=Microbacterium sp. 8M TaxID=2653153 RepID=UPI0012F26E19|nr:carbohydrate ABC transporter permease [Microbacterium sp. 8M]VXB34252.1 ABC transporter (permease) for alpha-galacturonides [Microbacterium sp. 8M]
MALIDSEALTPTELLTTSPAGRRRSRSAARGVKVKETRADRIFVISAYVLLTVFLLVVLLPLLNVLASSFSSPQAVSSGRVLFWPVDFTLRGYEVALGNPAILRGFANSIFYTVAGTVISVAGTVAIAYPLSRGRLYGTKALTGFVVFTMLFSGGLIPMYLVVQSLGLLDTRWSMLLPNAIGVWQVIIAMVFFRSSIPEELYEAAQLDGAGELRILWTVVLPLAKPLLAVIALMYAIMQWNSYFDALLYLRSADLQPLQLVLRGLLIVPQSGSGGDVAAQLQRRELADLLKYSTVVIATVPMLIAYPFVSKYFSKGIMVGAVKG